MIRQKPDPSGSPPSRKSPRWTPDLLVIKVKERTVNRVPEALRLGAATFRDLQVPEAFARPFEALLRRKKVLEVIPLFAPEAPRNAVRGVLSLASGLAASVRSVEDHDLTGINVIRFEPGTNLDAERRRLEETPGVEYCHKIPRRWLAMPTRSVVDPMLNRQWNLRAVHWFHAHPLPDASGIKVGVLDSGIDTRHPDLPRAAVYRHSGESSFDHIGHGSHVTGIIAAKSNNSVGIAGITNPELHIWKIFDDEPDPDDGEYYVDDIAYMAALRTALRTGVQVLNLSVGGEETSRTEKLLFKKLLDAGVVIVAAMGNEYRKGNPIEYPAAYKGIIAVGAIDPSNKRADFSNTGSHISLSAPGVGILSTLPMRGSDARRREEVKYYAWDGTSMATPHVTAAAALLLAKNPSMDPADVVKRLKKTATPLPRARKNSVGAGLLNIKAALG